MKKHWSPLCDGLTVATQSCIEALALSRRRSDRLTVTTQGNVSSDQTQRATRVHVCEHTWRLRTLTHTWNYTCPKSDHFGEAVHC